MASIYTLEPPTSGKVILITSVGDIEVELWCKECPLACRNFIQLCLEGYYDNTIFHRVVPGFIVQGGDPSGSGNGGMSIYGEAFKDEFHSRLKFNRRGLLAMANTGEKNDNNSQFFFTLDKTPELQLKNTLFGKIEGTTLYNMLKIGEGEVEGPDSDQPVYPVKLISTKVILNPYDDLVLRDIYKEEAKSEAKTKKITKKKKR
ncbi:cyclophilin-like protein [Neoconidiobolus thromboides FSU 785]|nr:cyclophilin-like protein [Neoconidiobolus thromboides FSU 785]